MAKAIPAISSIVPPAKPEQPPVILVRWDEARKVWLVKEPSHGWTAARGPGAAARGYSDAQLAAVVRRMYGAAATKGARIVRVESGQNTPAP